MCERQAILHSLIVHRAQPVCGRPKRLRYLTDMGSNFPKNLTEPIFAGGKRYRCNIQPRLPMES